ncbi:MAG: hypothetical protein K1X86_15560 [Ignavibacteria bacterium]|nr:hypothetical protein [Ignavibacteria bacterium]
MNTYKFSKKESAADFVENQYSPEAIIFVFCDAAGIYHVSDEKHPSINGDCYIYEGLARGFSSLAHPVTGAAGFYTNPEELPEVI